ncbi:31243_t:CDS:1, partial [Racocetra persica]
DSRFITSWDYVLVRFYDVLRSGFGFGFWGSGCRGNPPNPLDHAK